MGTLSDQIVGAAAHHASAKSGLAELLGWIKDHLLNAIAITALATAATVFVPFILRALDRRRQPESVEPSRKDRARLLERVHNRWITAVLEPSLADNRLDLGLHRRPDLIGNRNQAAHRSRGPAAIQPGKTISQIFDDAGAGLLILGAPGSGKTTLLLQLAQELLQRASTESEEPVPIVASLSSWARQSQPLSTWLTEEVARRQYKVPPSAFRYWVARNKVILLLDGLDEIDASKRDACTRAINAFRDEHGLTGIAVCCLTSEAEELATQLELEEAIQLEPPTDSQVASYLLHMEATGTPAADIRSAIEADDDLRELLRTPLMLHIITRACDGSSATTLQQPGSAEERLHRLWDEYVESMFQRRSSKGRRNTPQQEMHWLEWLASALRDRNQTEFQLDHLRRDWLPRRTRARRQAFELPIRLLGFTGISPAEGIYWSWAKPRYRFRHRPFRSLSVIICCLALLPVNLAPGTVLPPGQVIPFPELPIGIIPAVTFILAYFFWEAKKIGPEAAPNERVRRSAIDSLIITVPLTLTFGMLGVDVAETSKLGSPIVFGIIVFLITLPPVGLMLGFGIFLEHYLVRALLAQSGDVPWRYRRFLDSMTDRQLMHRSGGSYLFVHRLLRDHLAQRAGGHMPRTRSTSAI